MAGNLGKEPPEMLSASEDAYQVIRRLIVDGDLPAGYPLVEQDLADKLGTSRTPVRDAIRRLQTEGLVEDRGRRRSLVRAFSEDDIDECFEIRARLESYAAFRAATRMTADSLAELSHLADLMDALLQSGDADVAQEFSKLHDQFHMLVAECAQSARLLDVMDILIKVQLVALSRFAQTMERHLKRSCQHHRELIAAFESCDPVWAEATMRAHLLSARNPKG